VPPQATVGPYAHKYAERTSVAQLHDRTPVRYAKCTPTVCVTVGRTLIRCGTYSRTLVRVRKTKLRVVGDMSTPRADWLLGLPLTIFHGMWLVFSNA
jgi:hypothetical protein